jgi:hypothetical protein
VSVLKLFLIVVLLFAQEAISQVRDAPALVGELHTSAVFADEQTSGVGLSLLWNVEAAHQLSIAALYQTKVFYTEFPTSFSSDFGSTHHDHITQIAVPITYRYSIDMGRFFLFPVLGVSNEILVAGDHEGGSDFSKFYSGVEFLAILGAGVRSGGVSLEFQYLHPISDPYIEGMNDEEFKPRGYARLLTGVQLPRRQVNSKRSDSSLRVELQAGTFLGNAGGYFLGTEIRWPLGRLFSFATGLQLQERSSWTSRYPPLKLSHLGIPLQLEVADGATSPIFFRAGLEIRTLISAWRNKNNDIDYDGSELGWNLGLGFRTGRASLCFAYHDMLTEPYSSGGFADSPSGYLKTTVGVRIN